MNGDLDQAEYDEAMTKYTVKAWAYVKPADGDATVREAIETLASKIGSKLG